MDPRPDDPWYVYIVRCRDGTLYTGITKDPVRRTREHNGARAAAKYTRARRPVVLVYFEPHATRSAAARREHEIKRLPAAAKIDLVARGFSRGGEAYRAAGVSRLRLPRPGAGRRRSDGG